MRDWRGLWQGILILLAVVIVGLSGFIKTRGIPAPKVEPSSAVEASLRLEPAAASFG
jgi:hypothetical protein